MNTKTFFSASLITSLLVVNQANVLADEIIEPTGLSQIHTIIDSNTGLKRKVTPENIQRAHTAISAMNTLIREAIFNRGLANDNFISIADTREINRYLVEHHGQTWYALRGENLGTDSTGYYAVDKKGANTVALGSNAVALWGKVYDLGFPATGKRENRLSDYVGNKSASFKSVGYSLGQMTRHDVSDGQLYNADVQMIEGTTETGLDAITTAILADEGLTGRIATGDIRSGATAADTMNHLIIEAIKAEGLANDGRLSTADIRQINLYLVEHHAEQWIALHGNDENGVETGFHLVQNDGASARIFADNVVNTIADGIYHLGFATDHKNRLKNENGNLNKRFEKVAWWLDTLLKEELDNGTLRNAEYQEVTATTGSAFDRIIPYIYEDEGLLLKIPMADIRGGAAAANAMNKLIVEAIKATAVAEDDFISVEDVATLNAYLVTHHASEWAVLHGNDENGEETGYHLVQNDGARTTEYGRNVLNQLADSIYHLGFPTAYKKHLTNEDGDKNASFAKVAYWLNASLQDDYASGFFK